MQRASGIEPTILPEPISREDPARVAQLAVRRSRLRDLGITDEDGRGRIPEYVLDFPAYEVVPQTVKDGWTRGSSGRVRGPSGKYVSKTSDTPRLSYDGVEPGLLVEAGSRTNEASDSSDPALWNKNEVGSLLSVSGSIFADQASNGKINPQSVKASTGDGFDHVNHNCGNFTSGIETQYLIIEQDTSDHAALFIRNGTDGANGPRVEYRFSTETVTINKGPVRRANARVLSENGPNDGKLVQLILTYDVSQASALDSGDVRTTQCMPDTDGDKGATILHHHQVETAPNASSPIVTGSSGTTRSGDDYSIFEGGQPEWYSNTEGTFIVSLKIRFYNFEQRKIISFLPSGSRLGYEGSGFRLTLGNQPQPANQGIGNRAAYGRNNIAWSTNSDRTILSVDGQSDSEDVRANVLNDTQISLTNNEQEPISYYKIVYIPRALPESTLNRITR